MSPLGSNAFYTPFRGVGAAIDCNYYNSKTWCRCSLTSGTSTSASAAFLFYHLYTTVAVYSCRRRVAYDCRRPHTPPDDLTSLRRLVTSIVASRCRCSGIATTAAANGSAIVTVARSGNGHNRVRSGAAAVAACSSSDRSRRKQRCCAVTAAIARAETTTRLLQSIAFSLYTQSIGLTITKRSVSLIILLSPVNY